MPLAKDERWSEFRREMPIADRWAYFDHAAVAPIPKSASEAVSEWAREATIDGSAAWLRWNAELEKLRRTAAELVSASPEEIALVRSTTEGIGLVAEGFPWREGDNVVIPDNEFPSNQYPWLNLASRGVTTRRISPENGRLDLDKLADACDDRTRIIALSWVGFLSGWRTDLKAASEIAHRKGALLFVDAIQGLGGFPLNVQETQIDFFAADGHKWMLGPEGAGLFYIRREHLSKLRPIGVGWSSVVRDKDYAHIELRFKDSAARYEGGAPNSVGGIGFKAGLELLGKFGLSAIGDRILEITDLCCGRLDAIGAKLVSPRGKHENCSGIVTFELPGCDSMALRKHCYNQNVLLAHRSGKLRISPHAYINDEDIDRLIDSLESGKKACGALRGETR
jgi:cysteine desulfurase / selenocysteine lyase